MACTQSKTCPFVKLFSGKASLRVWSQSYCDGLWSECARLHVISDGGVPSSTLLPNGRSLDHQEERWRARGAA